MAAAGPGSRYGGVAAGAPTWIDQEPRLLSSGLVQAARLARRASRRYLLVGLLTALVAALAALKSVSKPPEYSAEVVLRLVEAKEDQTPMSMEQLRGAIWDVAFSGPRLLGVIRQLNLNPRWVDRDPSFAVDDFRDAISLTVWENDLISGAKMRRAARVSISYRTGIRERALPVTRALAELLVNTAGAQRRAQLQAQVDSAAEALKRATAQADALRAPLSGATAATGQAGVPSGMAMSALSAADERLRAAQARLVASQRELRETAGGQELHFEEVDPGREPPLPPSKTVIMLLSIVMAAAIAFPICLLMVGAFDPYLANGDDARAAGIPVLGLVPGTAGSRTETGHVQQPGV